MLPAGANRLTPCMIGLKRYIRPGLVVSVIGHLGVLIVGLVLVSANAFHAPPPDAMVVEVVTRTNCRGSKARLQACGHPVPRHHPQPMAKAPLPKRRRPNRAHSRSRKHNSVQTRSGRPKRSRRRVRRHRKRPRPS